MVGQMKLGDRVRVIPTGEVGEIIGTRRDRDGQDIAHRVRIDGDRYPNVWRIENLEPESEEHEPEPGSPAMGIYDTTREYEES